MLYKLVYGYPEKPPKEFIEDGHRTVGFTEDFLRSRGYKPLKESKPKNENQMDYYTETETDIIQHWI